MFVERGGKMLYVYKCDLIAAVRANQEELSAIRDSELGIELEKAINAAISILKLPNYNNIYLGLRVHCESCIHKNVVNPDTPLAPYVRKAIVALMEKQKTVTAVSIQNYIRKNFSEFQDMIPSCAAIRRTLPYEQLGVKRGRPVGAKDGSGSLATRTGNIQRAIRGTSTKRMKKKHPLYPRCPKCGASRYTYERERPSKLYPGTGLCSCEAIFAVKDSDTAEFLL